MGLLKYRKNKSNMFLNSPHNYTFIKFKNRYIKPDSIISYKNSHKYI